VKKEGVQSGAREEHGMDCGAERAAKESPRKASSWVRLRRVFLPGCLDRASPRGQMRTRSLGLRAVQSQGRGIGLQEFTSHSILILFTFFLKAFIWRLPFKDVVSLLYILDEAKHVFLQLADQAAV